MRIFFGFIQYVRDAIDWFRPVEEDVDFGEYGVLMRDEDGNLVPMDTETYERMKAQTWDAIEDHWLKLEAKALEEHGEGVLRMH